MNYERKELSPDGFWPAPWPSLTRVLASLRSSALGGRSLAQPSHSPEPFNQPRIVG
jgi:hypothetical protein